MVIGESLGGAVGAELATRQSLAGLILQSTFTSVRAMARRHHPLVPAFVVPDAYPTLDRIGRLRAPLLVVHGDRDAIVPISEGRALFDAAPEPKTFHVVGGAGHNDLVEIAAADYPAAITSWARRLAVV